MTRLFVSFALAAMAIGAFGKVAEGPRKVAVPPAAAVRDLCFAEGGEIRHYGWRVTDGDPRRVYIASRDGGESWTEHPASSDDFGAMQKSPYSGQWIGWRQIGNGAAIECGRSAHGPGHAADTTVTLPWKGMELCQMIAMRSRKRWVAAFSDVSLTRARWYQTTIAISDDDGASWRRIDVAPVGGVARKFDGDEMPHWFNDGCEPSVTELGDGTLLMAVRTSGPSAAFYRSSDGGETWSDGKADDAFWQSNTMPRLFRLRDGRILFIWNNTQPLPTLAESAYPELTRGVKMGLSEHAFNNRDALHAAISSDDGRTWKGFRELVLNPIRNASDFRERGNKRYVEVDKSVHQTQVLELSDGKVLVAYGQAEPRGIVKFDPDWLLEDGRAEDFSAGLDGVSTHLFVRSLSGHSRNKLGHCQWNRASGALLMRDPSTVLGTPHETLNISRVPDPRLVSDRQGVVWNFPAHRKGAFSTECRIDGDGFRLALTDHWINPCDWFNPQRSPIALEITTNLVARGKWHRLVCQWDLDAGTACLFCDGTKIAETPILTAPRYGLSYLHLQTLAKGADFAGSWFRSFKADGFTVNPIFADGMVFAADRPMRVFGDGVGKVEVSFDGATAKSVCADGKWIATLPPHKAGGPYELKIAAEDGVRTLRDVWVGEVILMAGQSNMQFVNYRSKLPADAYKDEPKLRCFVVTRSETNGGGFRTEDGWKVASRTTAPNWSALSYHLGVERVRRTGGAVGMVVCAQGASEIRSWLPETFAEDPRFNFREEDVGPDFFHEWSFWNTPGYLHKLMFSRLAPYSVHRAVWYQGESDAGEGGRRYYAPALAEMIGLWRRDLQAPELPFTVVQIADYDGRNDDKWRAIQAAQLEVPKITGGVTVVKCSDLPGREEIHPPDKRPLARRISDFWD